MSSSRKPQRSIAEEALDEVLPPKKSKGRTSGRRKEKKGDEVKKGDELKAKMEQEVLGNLKDKLAEDTQQDEEAFELSVAPIRNQPFWFVPKLCRMIEKRQALRKTMEERVARLNAAAAEK